jgi:hypothetical protein
VYCLAIKLHEIPVPPISAPAPAPILSVRVRPPSGARHADAEQFGYRVFTPSAQCSSLRSKKQKKVSELIASLEGPITCPHWNTHLYRNTGNSQLWMHAHCQSNFILGVKCGVCDCNKIILKEGQNSICLSREANPVTRVSHSTPQPTTSRCHNRTPLSSLRWLQCTVTVRLPLLSYVYSSVSCPFIVRKTELCLLVTYTNTEYIHCTQFALSMNTVTVSMGQY